MSSCQPDERMLLWWPSANYYAALLVIFLLSLLFIFFLSLVLLLVSLLCVFCWKLKPDLTLNLTVGIEVPKVHHLRFYAMFTSTNHGGITSKWIDCEHIYSLHWDTAPENDPDSKVHGAKMGPTWVLSAPGEPHVGPMNLAIRGYNLPSIPRNMDGRQTTQIILCLQEWGRWCALGPWRDIYWRHGRDTWRLKSPA